MQDIYNLVNYDSLDCNNLYAFVIERCFAISNNKDNIGMIVPLTIASNNNMLTIRKMLTLQGIAYFSHYEIRPAKLFDGVEQRLTIFILRQAHNNEIFSSCIMRWHNEEREKLFQSLYYGESVADGQIWRFSDKMELSIYRKFSSHKKVENYLSPTLQNMASAIHYRTAGVRYWIIFLCGGFGTEALSNKVNYFQEAEYAPFYCAAFNSNLFWWYYGSNFDMFNLKDYMIFGFRLTYSNDPLLAQLGCELEEDLYKNRQTLITNSRTRGIVSSYIYRKKRSKSIMDKIDTCLAKHYGFNECELDSIISKDLKFRQGDEND